MALRIQQLFLQTSNIENAIHCLRSCSRARGNTFAPHPKYKLSGVEQTLKSLVRKFRRFVLMPPSNGYCTVWEIVDHAEFADPGLAQCLSECIQAKSIWIKLDEDFNIWAYQVYQSGRLEDELFRPEDYFLGRTESGDFRSYGKCHTFAETFGRSNNLPHFLLTVPQLERDKHLNAISHAEKVKLTE